MSWGSCSWSTFDWGSGCEASTATTTTTSTGAVIDTRFKPVLPSDFQRPQQIFEQEITRKPINQQIFENSYDDIYWLNAYLQVKYAELRTNFNINKSDLNNYLRNAVTLYKNVDKPNALKYIHDTINVLKSV
jgi:hypothetical protein